MWFRVKSKQMTIKLRQPKNLLRYLKPLAILGSITESARLKTNRAIKIVKKTSLFLVKQIRHSSLKSLLVSFDLTGLSQAKIILILGSYVLALNLVNTQTMINERSFLAVSNENISQIVSKIDRFTPVLREDAEYTARSISGLTTDYVDLSKLAIEFPKERSHTVAKGETISQVAKIYNLHVASILERNSIPPDQADKITPGTALTIPTYDISSSQEWLEIAKKRDEEKKRAEEKRRLALQKSRQTFTRDRSTQRIQSQSNLETDPVSGWAKPLSYSYVSRRLSRFHDGIDAIAPKGTPVYAAKSGVITLKSGWGGGYGTHIVQKTSDGYESIYGHLSGFAAGLSSGQFVEQGQLIGYVGSTGFSTGSHLHFETRSNGRPFDSGI